MAASGRGVFSGDRPRVLERYDHFVYVDDDHPSFLNKPGDDAVVWRYMDLARFMSLLEENAIAFARGDTLSDRWEGSYSPVNLQLRPQMYGEHYEMMFRGAEERRQALLRGMHVSCWHVSETESAAMWEIYQREGRGVAVRSTWGDLTASLSSDEPHLIFGGSVRYVDYSSTFIPEGIVFDAFMHKRASFAHEREARLIFMSGYSMPHPTEPNTSINLGPEPPAIHVKVDLRRLIQSVYIAPDSPPWIAELVQKIVVSYGQTFPVQQSDLAKDPIA